MTAEPSRLPGGPVEGVLFDYGMTLITFRRPTAALERAYTHIARLVEERVGGPLIDVSALVEVVHDAVDAAVAAHEATGSLEEIRLAPVYEQGYRRLGVELPPDLLDEVQRIEQRAWFDGMTVPPGTTETLVALRRRGLRLGLCSNAPYAPAMMLRQVAHLGIDEYLDAITFSSAVGWRKPAPQLFEAALQSLGTTAAATVMVGDRVREDVEGATAAGMRTVLLVAHRREADPQRRATAVAEQLGDLVELLG